MLYDIENISFHSNLPRGRIDILSNEKKWVSTTYQLEESDGENATYSPNPIYFLSGIHLYHTSIPSALKCDYKTNSHQWNENGSDHCHIWVEAVKSSCAFLVVTSLLGGCIEEVYERFVRPYGWSGHKIKESWVPEWLCGSGPHLPVVKAPRAEVASFSLPC